MKNNNNKIPISGHETNTTSYITSSIMYKFFSLFFMTEKKIVKIRLNANKQTTIFR